MDLRVTGVRPYFEHPTTEVICMAWRIDNGPIHSWAPGDADPTALLAHVAAGHRVVAHKNNFDRTAWNLKLPKHWPRITIEQSDCTMARAQAIGLPASLDALGAALKTAMRKDNVGYKLMMKMCKPKTLEPLTWHDGPVDRAALMDYCEQDVATERDIESRLPPLTPFERQIWELDQKINERGVQLDMVMVRAGIAVAEELSRRAGLRIAALTGGAITKVTQAARIVKWLNDQGVPCESVSKDGHEELICLSGVFGDPRTDEVIALRSASAKAFKFGAMRDQVCADGRARDQLLYNATVSRRWAGQGIQVHNMKRVETEEDAADVEDIVRVFHSGASPVQMADTLELLFEKPLEKLSICSRACIIPAPGRKLVGGDYSNIEGRIAAWIAGEQWKLDAFRAYDAGTGPDLYKVTAAGIIGCEVGQVTKAQRQEQGKVPELACFGRDTRVVTNNGTKAIVDVTTADRLWDGTAWVTHDGLIDRGKKTVMMLAGVLLTPNHLIQCLGGWQPARTVAFNPHWRSLARATGMAALLSLASARATQAAFQELSFSASAELRRTKLAFPTCDTDAQHVAIHARSARQVRPPSYGIAMQMSYPITNIDDVSATEYPPVTTAAITPKTAAILITAGAVSTFTALGKRIARLSSATLRAWKGGIIQLWNWTGSMWTAVTNPAIFASSLARKMRVTAEKCRFYRPGSQNWRRVYDLANAGPRNRFTIVTDEGYLVVHNCGYQGSVGAFTRMGQKYGVKLTPERIKPIVIGWRDKNAQITAGWRELQDAAIEAVSAPGCIVPVFGGKVRYIMSGDFLYCRLPSGELIHYASPSVAWKSKTVIVDGDEVEFNRRTVSYWGQHKGWRQIDLYGGMQFAHVVSGTARDVLAGAMLKAETAGYEEVLTVHDELLAEGDDAERLRRIMMDLPDWLGDCPMAAATWEGDRYTK